MFRTFCTKFLTSRLTKRETVAIEMMIFTEKRERKFFVTG